jgi:uncharacterized protein YbjT (DUF2867 family)
MTTTPALSLVTGATGNTGDTTVRLLLRRGHRVRAFVHRADTRSESLASAGAEIAVGDLLDFDAVSAALDGVTGAYFCYPIAPGLLEATTLFAQAAVDAGVKAVVNMSQISARRDATSHAAQHHWIAERLLDRTPMLTTHLRPTFFAEWLDWYWATDGTSGVIRLPMGAALPSGANFTPQPASPAMTPPSARSVTRNITVTKWGGCCAGLHRVLWTSLVSDTRHPRSASSLIWTFARFISRGLRT